MLGLGNSLQKTGLKKLRPGIVTSGLVLKQNYDTGAVVPISDGAASFDGSAAINTGEEFKSTIAAGNLSVAFWLGNSEGSDASGNRFLFGAKDSASENQFYIAYTSSGTLLCRMEGNNDPDTMSGSHVLLPNHPWTHIAATFALGESAGGDGKVYVNGVLDGDASLSGVSKTNWNLYDSSSNVFIGAMSNAGSITSATDGYMCNVGIWSEVLDVNQIKSIMYKNYAGLNGSETTNLVSWWGLGEETATDGTAGTGGVKDYHGTNHGTLI
tara:strand:- start:2229 stop:3035 length:807 start_codon:yes stop_codon:yes gene_type:complete